MQYLECKPSDELRPYVQKLWFCSSYYERTLITNVPFIHHELVFNLSASHQILPTRYRTGVITNPLVWLGGLQQTAYLTRSCGHHAMIGVVFKPGGLQKITREHVSVFTDQFIDASLVFGTEILSLLDQLESASEIQQKFNFLQLYLRNRLAIVHSEIPPFLAFAIHAMESEFLLTRGRMSTISAVCGITNKSLIQVFKQYLGVAPMKFQHMILVTQALRKLAEDPTQKLTSLAMELGFYDQSHFIRIFKRFTSYTPSQYAAIRTKTKSSGAASHYIVERG